MEQVVGGVEKGFGGIWPKTTNENGLAFLETQN